MPKPVQDAPVVNQTDNAEPKAPVTDPSSIPTPAQDDLVARASQVSLPADAPTPTDTPDGIQFDANRHKEVLAKLDPEVAKEVEAYKRELFSGANRRFMEASDLMKEAQAVMQENPQIEWTPERVQQLTQDPNFIKAAEVAYGKKVRPAEDPYAEEDPYNEDPARKEALEAKQKNAELEKKVNAFMWQQHIERENETLKTKYKNYDSTAVNNLRQQLIQGKVRATGEHLHKVMDYENYGKRCYELGKQDRQMEMTDKLNANPVETNGINVTQSNEVPVKTKGMSTQDHFRQIALAAAKRLQAAKNKT